MAWRGLPWCDMVWYGMVWYGMVIGVAWLAAVCCL